MNASITHMIDVDKISCVYNGADLSYTLHKIGVSRLEIVNDEVLTRALGKLAGRLHAIRGSLGDGFNTEVTVKITGLEDGLFRLHPQSEGIQTNGLYVVHGLHSGTDGLSDGRNVHGDYPYFFVKQPNL